VPYVIKPKYKLFHFLAPRSNLIVLRVFHMRQNIQNKSTIPIDLQHKPLPLIVKHQVNLSRWLLNGISRVTLAGNRLEKEKENERERERERERDPCPLGAFYQGRERGSPFIFWPFDESDMPSIPRWNSRVTMPSASALRPACVCSSVYAIGPMRAAAAVNARHLFACIRSGVRNDV